MNEAPSNQTGLSDTFSSQQATQGNPFTADLKNEFTSNFGTNTNAVSQIFKEGGFANQNRAKYFAIGGVVILLLAGLFYYLYPDDGESEGETDKLAETPAEKEAEESTADSEEEKVDKEKTDEAKDKKEVVQEPAKKEEPIAQKITESKPKKLGGVGVSMGKGPISLDQPAEGSTIAYDESQGAAQFTWNGGGGYIVFSRSPSMNPPALRMPTKGNSYSFQQPWPGKWYWRVENRSGKSEVRSFTVNAPVRRGIALESINSGGTISGSNGVVSWKGDARVAYYRVEMSSGGWANPQHRFASSGNSVKLEGVPPGQYKMRLGAFSEVAGRWEYTTPINVTVN